MIRNIACASYFPSNFTTGKGWEILCEGMNWSSMEEKDMDAWEYGSNSKSGKAQEGDKQKQLFLVPQSLVFSWVPEVQK